MTNFIGKKYVSDLSICDDLIEYFKESKDKVSGEVYLGNSLGSNTDLNAKKSTDVRIYPNDFNTNPRLTAYLNELNEITKAYIEHFPHCNSYAAWAISESCNIQYYKPGEGYTAWHTERGVGHGHIAARHLAFMTYLNDVTDEGETQFFHQDLKVQPSKGLTLIWPVDWTYTHRGISSTTQDKYIITGWFSYL